MLTHIRRLRRIAQYKPTKLLKEAARSDDAIRRNLESAEVGQKFLVQAETKDGKSDVEISVVCVSSDVPPELLQLYKQYENEVWRTASGPTINQKPLPFSAWYNHIHVKHEEMDDDFDEDEDQFGGPVFSVSWTASHLQAGAVVWQDIEQVDDGKETLENLFVDGVMDLLDGFGNKALSNA
jgi:hypothetical protein